MITDHARLSIWGIAVPSVIAPAHADGTDKAPAVSRSIKVLKLLAQHLQGLILSEIARSLSLAKSSTFNICAALEDGGMVTRTDLGYALGRETAVIAQCLPTIVRPCPGVLSDLRLGWSPGTGAAPDRRARRCRSAARGQA